MFVLERPIVFIDFETTGVDKKKDRIVEIGICKVYPDKTRKTFKKRVNPETPIPPESTAIHNITDEMVAKEAIFGDLARGILTFIEGCDLAGFNSDHFDFPVLYMEFLRVGIEWDYTKHHMVDAGSLFKIMEPRTLSAAVQYYLGRPHEDAHSAEADIIATADVLFAMIDKYGETVEDFPQNIETLALFTNYKKIRADMGGTFSVDNNGDYIFNIGKTKGMLAKNDLGMCEWILSKDFMPDAKKIASQLIEQYG